LPAHAIRAIAGVELNEVGNFAPHAFKVSDDRKARSTFMPPEDSLTHVIDDRALRAVREVLPARISRHAPSNEPLRRFIEGSLLVMLHGRFWANLPRENFGNSRSNFSRHDRWVEGNVWPSIAEALQLDDSEKERISQHCERRIRQKRRNSERRLRRILSDTSDS